MAAPTIKRAAFVVSARTGHEGDLKKLESLKTFKLYPYVTDSGRFGTGAVFSKVAPSVTHDQAQFFDSGDAQFLIDTSPQGTLSEAQTALLRSTRYLKGSRIEATSFTPKTVKTLAPGVLYVEGTMEGARDPRLEFMDGEEQTEFGTGQFDPTHIKASYDGDYVYLKLSPWAETLKLAAANQQKMAEEYFKLHNTEPNSPKAKRLEEALRVAERQLKPHAYEVYDYREGYIYFINGLGHWENAWTGGLRTIDAHDRARIRKFLKDKSPQTVDDYRAQLGDTPAYDRWALDATSIAMAREVKRREKDDETGLEAKRVKYLELKPIDGPLGAKDLPGLKPGVKFFPHQSLILASLREDLRKLIDADPGAGKSLLIICDILQQIKAKSLKRPLVIMPEYLLPQFAQEVRHFSELNPWIINTESIARWGSDLAGFIKSAKKSPPNTVFLTSYNWLGRGKKLIPTGEVSQEPQKDGTVKLGYEMSEVFTHPQMLQEELGVDAIFMDEVHCLKNESNQSYATVCLAGVPVVRGLTGTIMPGNLLDVTGPMGVIHSGVFGSGDEFLEEFSEDGTPNMYREDAPKEIRQKLREFGTPQVRRSAWQHLLPSSNEQFHYVKFTPTQQTAYDAILTNLLDEVRNDPKLAKQLEKLERELQENGEELEASGHILARFVPLDVFLNSPSSAKKEWTKALSGEDLISPKAKIINEICLKHLAQPDHGKILIFTQFRDSAQGLLDALDPKLKEVAKYYEGGMVDVLNQLKNPADPLQIMIGVDRSLRTGHNIQAVNCIIHADLLWMNGDMQQREARSLRIGQKRNVEIHYVVTEGSAEMLKMARLISADHMVSKANSNFDEKTTLQPIKMSLDKMETFRHRDQLEPFTERKSELKRQYLVQAEVEKKTYGSNLLTPAGHASIDEELPNAKILRTLPSAKNFVGTADVEELVKKHVEKLPVEPLDPKVLEFHMKKLDDDWLMICYYTSDPQGFLRRFGFSLSRSMYCLETGTKAGAISALKRMESQGFEIIEKDELLETINDTVVTAPSAPKQKIQREEKESKRRTKQKVAAEVASEIYLEFGLFDGSPYLWVDTLDDDAPEIARLLELGFKSEPAMWYKEVTRSSLTQVLTRLQQQHKAIKLTAWDKFKDQVFKAFRGLDLSNWDSLALKNSKQQKAAA